MTWGRLDDKLYDHPKVLAAGPLASWLNVCAITWSNRHLTDGHIPEHVIPKLASFDGIYVKTRQGMLEDVLVQVQASDLVRVLVDAGVWEHADGGFRIHDFLDYNPSREQVRAMREAEAEAKRRGGKKRAEGAPRDTGGRFAPTPRDGDSGDISGAVPDDIFGRSGVSESAGHRQDVQLPTSSPPAPDPGPYRDLSEDVFVGAREKKNASGLTLEEAVPHGWCRDALEKLAKSSRTWESAITDPAQLQELARIFREAELRKFGALLEQARHKTDQRKPLAWLRSLALSEEASA